MMIDGCEGGDGIVWWDFDERDFPTKGASAINATFQSIVPGSERQFYLARATYTFSAVDVVLCGNKDNDDKGSSGRVSGTVEASKNNDGSSEAKASINIDHTTDSGFEVKGSLGGNITQDKDGNVQAGGFGSVSLEIKY